MAREQGRKIVAQNKKARHDYHIDDTYEAGLVLVGTEVKSLRQGRASLVDGFAEVDGGEVWLHNVHIPEYTQGTWTNHAARRKRKLLLNRSEIAKHRAQGRARRASRWSRSRSTSRTAGPRSRSPSRAARRSTTSGTPSPPATPTARRSRRWAGT